MDSVQLKVTFTYTFQFMTRNSHEPYNVTLRRENGLNKLFSLTKKFKILIVEEAEAD